MKTHTLLLCTFSILFAARAEPPNHSGGDSAGPRLSVTDRALSLATVTQAVLTENPAIKEARKKWNAMRERVAQEAAWDDLRITGQSRVARFISIPPNAFMDQALAVEQMIPISGKNRSRARIAAAEALSAWEELRRTELDVITKARTAYFQLLNAYGQLEINRKNLVSLKQIADISRSKYSVGAATAADVLVAETDASKLMEARRDLQRKLSDAQSQINVMMNRDAFAPVGEPEPASLKPVEFTLPQLRAMILASRPEVKLAQDKIEAEKAKLQLAHRQWIPDPAVGVEAQRYNNAAQSVSEVGAMVSFNVPWGNYRKYSAGVREATESLGGAERGLERAQTEAIGLLRDQLQKIETLHHHVELFGEKIVPQARQAFEANQFAYESGKASFLDWITAQRTLRDIEAMALDHRTNYQIAVAELESVIGAEIHPRPSAPARTKGKTK